MAFGVADGGGPTVLFLHGWGLAHHCYSASLRMLAGAGYRVIAPDLPGFGGTSDLPIHRLSIAGYAAFLDQLLEALEISEPVDVIGHSFGGGVAVQFAHDVPARVRSVVLVDSVSGATWVRSGERAHLLATRPLWDWAYHLLLELPVAEAPRAVPGLLRQVAGNMIRHPATLGLVAQLIRRLDLSAELSELQRRALPVRVVWGSGDRVVPRPAYEDVCTALGCEGETVPGSHSWPLSEPARFATVVATALAVPAADAGTAGRPVA